MVKVIYFTVVLMQMTNITGAVFRSIGLNSQWVSRTSSNLVGFIFNSISNISLGEPMRVALLRLVNRPEWLFTMHNLRLLRLPLALCVYVMCMYVYVSALLML